MTDRGPYRTASSEEPETSIKHFDPVETAKLRQGAGAGAAELFMLAAAVRDCAQRARKGCKLVSTVEISNELDGIVVWLNKLALRAAKIAGGEEELRAIKAEPLLVPGSGMDHSP